MTTTEKELHNISIGITNLCDVSYILAKQIHSLTTEIEKLIKCIERKDYKNEVDN